MSELYADGDLFLPIRTKINALASFLKIAETDVLISAGAVTSIPVVTLTKNLLYHTLIDKVQLMDLTTGEVHELTLTADMVATNTALTVSSHTFTSDIPVGSGIYLKLEDLLAYIYSSI